MFGSFRKYSYQVKGVEKMSAGVSAIGIILTLFLIMYLAFRRWSILIVAPIGAVLVALFSSKPVLEALLGPYSQGLANYARLFFLIFLLGSIMGKLMEDSGAAESIAFHLTKLIGTRGKIWAALSVALIAAILTYGGVVVFVIVFAIAPIALPLFRKMDVPWQIFPGLVSFGGATFTMSMLPGSPAIQNVIPTRYLGTDGMAGADLGLIAAVVTIVLNVWYYWYVVKKSESKGIGFAGLGEDVYQKEFGSGEASLEEKNLPNLWLSLLPLLAVVVLFAGFKLDIVYSLAAGNLLLLVFFWHRLRDKITSLSQGASNSILPLMNTCAIVGFGSVVAGTAGYKLLQEGIMSFPADPMITLAIATNVLVGLTGSASGGLGIAMEVLAEPYMALGLSPELIHRISAIAAAGMDTLPHNGWVISTLIISRMTHREGYFHMFVSSVLTTLAALVVALVAAIIIY